MLLARRSRRLELGLRASRKFPGQKAGSTWVLRGAVLRASRANHRVREEGIEGEDGETGHQAVLTIFVVALCPLSTAGGLAPCRWLCSMVWCFRVRNACWLLGEPGVCVSSSSRAPRVVQRHRHGSIGAAGEAQGETRGWRLWEVGTPGSNSQRNPVHTSH